MSGIKPEMVPSRSAKAIADLFPPGYLESVGLHPESIAAAALNAWPGVERQLYMFADLNYCLILPLTQEQTDEQ